MSNTDWALLRSLMGVNFNDDAAPVMAASSMALAAFAADDVEAVRQPAAAMAPGLRVVDTSTGEEVAAAPSPYLGSVAGIEWELIDLSPKNLAITAPGPNWFIRTGAGDDAITAHGGRNVLDGGGGSNFLTGGAGADTFFGDARDLAAPVWTTLATFAAATPQPCGASRPSASTSPSTRASAPPAIPALP